MTAGTQNIEARVARLERLLDLARMLAALTPLGILMLFALLGAKPVTPPPRIQDQVITRRLIVVDQAGRARVLIAQDPEGSQRRSRAVGLWVFDSTGAERGGFSTLEDGSVGLGMDAPQGVGAPMGERLSLSVAADGSADVMLLDNLTRAVTKLRSEGNGDGGLQVFKWDMEGKKIQVRTVICDGDRHETVPMN